MNLDSLLAEFVEAMKAKFWARRERALSRWGHSVTDEDFPWGELDPDRMEPHYREEIRERFAPGADARAEDIDVANMAFLDWVARRFH